MNNHGVHTRNALCIFKYNTRTATEKKYFVKLSNSNKNEKKN